MTNLLDYPAANGRPVTQGHANMCAERGHATWTYNGEDKGICPRCGDVTKPAAEQVAEDSLLLALLQARSLAELVDAYAEAKDAADAAADRLKDLRDQLLLAHGEILPDEHPLVGTRAVVKVTTVSTWRVDTTRLKSEQPALYAAYARQSSTTKVTVSPR